MKQRIKGTCKALSVLNIDTDKVRYIPTIGKQIFVVLTVSAYAPTLKESSCLKGNTIAHFEILGPFSLDGMKRIRGIQDIVAEGLLESNLRHCTGH